MPWRTVWSEEQEPEHKEMNDDDIVFITEKGYEYIAQMERENNEQT